MRKKIIVTLLLVIIFLAAFLRFYRLTEVPVSPYWDGVASTYNAYSIALTGKDEYGTPYPVLFRSFNDYKMGGNIYLTSIAVRILGINEFSNRVSSALFGTLTVLSIFLLLRSLLQFAELKNNSNKLARIFNHSTEISIVAAFLYTISPWSLEFSRGEFEGNVAVFFLVTGVWLLIRYIRSYSFPNLLVAGLSFAMSCYTYRSIHIFLPLFLVAFILIFRENFFNTKHIKKTLIGAGFFFILVIPLIPIMLSKQGLERARQVNVFTHSEERLYQSAVLLKNNENNIFYKIIFNRRIVYAQIILENYFSNFSPDFLFINGDPNPRHSSVDKMGQLYIWEIPFLLLGLFICFRYFNKPTKLIIAWILIGPIAASFSIPNPHSLRTLNMVPALETLSAIGIVCFYLLVKGFSRKIYVVGLFLMIFIFFLRYISIYYGRAAFINSSAWADGYKQLTQYVFNHEKKYDKVIISGHYWQPYIFFLFFKKYSPVLYQKYGNKREFDKYVFGGTSWDKEQYSQELKDVNLQQFAKARHILIALSPEEYEGQRNNIRELTRVYNHNNELVFIVGEMQ